jgi:hypothetical protein
MEEHTASLSKVEEEKKPAWRTPGFAFHLILAGFLLCFLFNMKMEAVCFSRTSVNLYWITGHYSAEDCVLCVKFLIIFSTPLLHWISD